MSYCVTAPMASKCLWCGKFSGCKCRDLSVAFDWKGKDEADALLDEVFDERDEEGRADRALYPAFPETGPRRLPKVSREG